jgi:tetratricopeptide (TPR) repeat protein
MSLIPEGNNELIIKQAKECYYKENSFNDAINLLDEQLKISKDQNLYYEKANLYIENNKIQNAVDTINVGLENNSKNYLLLQLKVQLVLIGSVNLNANEAIDFLKESLEVLKKCLSLFYEDRENFPGYIEQTKFLFKENELKLLESNVKNLIYSNTVLQAVNNTKLEVNKTIQIINDTISNERKNIFQLLGLFTALIAFIISGVNIAKDKPLLEGVILIVAIGLILMTFLLGIHMIEIQPRRTKELWWIILIYIFILLCLPFVPNLIMYISSKF